MLPCVLPMIYAAYHRADEEKWAIVMLDNEALICPRVRVVAVISPASHPRGFDPDVLRRERRPRGTRTARARRRPVRAR